MFDDAKNKVGQISNNLEQHDKCDVDTLDACVKEALAGLRNMEDRNGLLRQQAGIAEMKGEWTIRRDRAENRTEAEFADEFVIVLGELLHGE